LSFTLSSPGFGNNSFLGIVKESKFEDGFHHPSESRTKSHISLGS